VTSALEAVASPRRREILRIVWNRELPAGEIAAEMPEISFGAVSQHLKLLAEAGLLDRRAEGRARYYRARKDALGPLRRTLEAMWGDALMRLKSRAELEAARRGPRPARGRKRRRT
jgi:DNA-binding transcriptional ArsR family regulator